MGQCGTFQAHIALREMFPTTERKESRVNFWYQVLFVSEFCATSASSSECSEYILVKSNERSEYSYIGLAVFFSGKSLKRCSRSILIFRGLTCDFFFKFSAFLLLKGRPTPLSSIKSVKITKNVIEF